MAITEQQLIRELTRLRHGWALQAENLSARLGQGLRAMCELDGTHKYSNGEARDRVAAALTRLTADFPPDLKAAIRYALAIDPKAAFASLQDRTERLAVDLHCADRTARRRVQQAFRRLAEETAQRQRCQEVRNDPETGWHVTNFRALLRLDGQRPELIEERTIIALRDDLERIAVRFSLPPVDGDNSAPELTAEIQRGAVLERTNRLGRSHFQFLLRLPRPLKLGEHHSYTITFWVSADQPLRPHYVFVPLVACDRFQLSVRFDPARAPKSLWRLNDLAPRLLDELPAHKEELTLDRAHEITLDFTEPRQGFAYGVGWHPA